MIPEVITPDITEHLLDDEELAESLNYVIRTWTKEISIGDWETAIVPDYHLRLKGIDMSLKLKWHYREKRVKSWLVDGIYKLV